MEEKNNDNMCNHEQEGCDCCGEHDHDTVMITFDNDTDVECVILGLFDVEDIEYIALMPVGDEEVLIYRYSDNSGDIKLEQIESDEEYEKVSEEFYKYIECELEENDDK